MSDKRDLEELLIQQQQMLAMLQEMYSSLQSTNSSLQSTNSSLQTTNASLQKLLEEKDAEIARLNEIIRNFGRSLFGQKSEKSTYIFDGQPLLPFPELAGSQPAKSTEPAPQSEAPQTIVKEHKRSKRT